MSLVRIRPDRPTPHGGNKKTSGSGLSFGWLVFKLAVSVRIVLWNLNEPAQSRVVFPREACGAEYPVFIPIVDDAKYPPLCGSQLYAVHLRVGKGAAMTDERQNIFEASGQRREIGTRGARSIKWITSKENVESKLERQSCSVADIYDLHCESNPLVVYELPVPSDEIACGDDPPNAYSGAMASNKFPSQQPRLADANKDQSGRYDGEYDRKNGNDEISDLELAPKIVAPFVIFFCGLCCTIGGIFLQIGARGLLGLWCGGILRLV